MAKLTLNPISSGYASNTAHNANLDLIEAAIENTLSRDGTTPNEMLDNIDLNGYKVINLGEPVNAADAARLVDVQAATTTGLPSQTGHTNHFLKSDGTVVTWGPNSNYSVTGITTLSASNINNLGVLSGTTYTVTLPTASSVSSGDVLNLKCTTSGNVTIARASTDTIGMSSATVTSMIMKNGDTLTLVSNGSNQWVALNAFIQAGTGAVGRAQNSKERDEINVRDYGAIGDGSTDDTAALHAARDAAGADAEIIVPAGTYVVTGLILNVAGQTWVLNKRATIKRGVGASGSTVSITAANVTLKGGRINGNRATVASGSGLDTSIAATEATIDGVHIYDAKEFGMYLEGSGVRVINSKVITSEQQGIFVIIDNNTGDTEGPFINNCIVDQRALASTVLTGGIFLRGNSTGPERWLNGNVSGNKVFLTNNPSVSTVGIESIYTDRTYINNNSVTGGYIGISLGSCRDNLIDGNVCFSQNQIGIEIAQTSLDCVVSNNVIDGNSLCDDGIEISSSATPSERIIVIGNTVRRLLATTGKGIADLNSIDVNITGNTVNAAGAQAGIYTQIGVAGVSYAKISGNYVIGNGTATYGIQIDTPTGINVNGNYVKACTTGIQLQCATASTLSSNIIANNILVSTTTPIGTSLSGGAAWASSNRWLGNVGYLRNSRAADVLDVLNDIIVAWGGGTPEGVVTAGIGSKYYRTDGGASQALYSKETGTGNTGWVAK